MPNLRDIRKRIRSVKNTQQITRAMRMVAAAKLRRAQETAINSRPYADGMQEVIHHIAARAEVGRHALLQAPASGGCKLVVVVTADRGLCGGFNVNVCKHAMAVMDKAEADGVEAKLYVVGRKGLDFFRRRPYTIAKHKVNIFQKLGFGHGSLLADELMQFFLEEGAAEVVMIYNYFKSTISQVIRELQLLPFTPGEATGRLRPGELDYIYEPDADTILHRMLPLAVRIEVYHVLLESLAAEQAARMMAMENATKNAGEVIDHLTLTMNKVRQASITRELIEVVSGAQALG